MVVERESTSDSSILITNLATIEKVTMINSCDVSKYTKLEECNTYLKVKDDDLRSTQRNEFTSADNLPLIYLMFNQSRKLYHVRNQWEWK